MNSYLSCLVKGLFVLFMRGMVCLKEKVCEFEGTNVSLLTHIHSHTSAVHMHCTSMPASTIAHTLH